MRRVRRLLIGVAFLVFSATAATAAIEMTRYLLEKDSVWLLGTDVKRRAIEMMAVTLNGNVMGSVALLGLVNQPIKDVVRGAVPLHDQSVMETLQAVGEFHQANGVYVVNSNGIVQSCWYTMGVTLTGVDVKFRPYFQIAMQGKQNVYAAVGTTTGQRSLYFAAPLFRETSPRAPVIGVTVARLDLERVDSILRTWSHGPSLLLSPQGITFASNRDDFVMLLDGETTPERMKTIRDLKQFGKVFDAAVPAALPFDTRNPIVAANGRRYAVAKAPVHWNDPHGDWHLVLLNDLDQLMLLDRQIKIAAGTVLLLVVMGAVVLLVQRRMQQSERRRQQAEQELTIYTRKLEVDAFIKAHMARIATELQQANSLADLAKRLMFHVMPLLDADYGVVYVLDDESQRLDPIGGYGVMLSDIAPVAIGQGLVGQCARDQAPLTVSHPNGQAIRIVLGVGELTPGLLTLQPIIHADRLLGVLLLAMIEPFDADKHAILAALMPIVAVNCSSMRDITERERMQQALRDQAAFQQDLINAIPYPVFYKGPDTRFLGFNTAYEQIFNVSRGDLIGKRVLDLEYLPEADRIAYQAEDEATIAEAGSVRREMLIPFADGVFHETLYFVSGFRKADGTPSGLVGTFVDIAEQKRADKAQRESLALREKMVDVERFNRLAQGREQRIIDLKRQVNVLADELGRQPVFTALDSAGQIDDVVIDAQEEDIVDSRQSLQLGDLVDLSELQALFSNFCETVGVAAAIIDLRGVVLASSRWQRAYTDFHRVHPMTCARCIESDTDLAIQLSDGADFTLYRCKNGMTDCASPIIVDGQHLANVFIGQFHLNRVDEDFFRQQANEFGFPQQDYLRAVSEAPILDEQRVPAILGFLSGFAKMVASISMERWRANKAQDTLKRQASIMMQQRAVAMSLAEDAEAARVEMASYQQKGPSR
ncbi:MAG: PocR ligand-binding domain-containing protein [Magnetococcales bacterium]|nr:PocR ligand-binding domain-containing protein [Magnetococcales bacterium]